MTYYVNLSKEEMMDFKQYCTLDAFQNVNVGIMHNHDDEHPAWSGSEIIISVLINSRLFVLRRNGV